MPPKKGNSKAEAAKAKKEANQQQKDAQKAQLREQEEASKWESGADTKRSNKAAAEAQKKAELQARKAKAKKLLEEEESQLKATAAASGSSGNKKAGAVTRGSAKAAAKKQQKVEQQQVEQQALNVEEFAATNIDDALDLLDVAATTTSGGASSGGKKQQFKTGSGVTEIEKHPERRAKAAYKAYEDANLARLRKENPSLRLTQVKELMWQEWQKSPENPFNKTVLSYNASKDEERDAVEALRKQTEDRLRIK
ncbi:hypothetical protein MP228_012990 [Amoeboaphelidium protococcarum]|nr:hypothetical protein MP228_012990 [Amoeboaphelidium protococcarum]